MLASRETNLSASCTSGELAQLLHGTGTADVAVDGDVCRVVARHVHLDARDREDRLVAQSVEVTEHGVLDQLVVLRGNRSPEDGLELVVEWPSEDGDLIRHGSGCGLKPLLGDSGDH